MLKKNLCKSQQIELIMFNQHLEQIYNRVSKVYSIKNDYNMMFIYFSNKKKIDVFFVKFYLKIKLIVFSDRKTVSFLIGTN